MKFDFYISEDREIIKQENREKKPALNPMCADCVKYKKICTGSHENIYTGCIYKRKKYA